MMKYLICVLVLVIANSLACDDNEVSTSCGSKCKATCANPNPVCPEECVATCACKSGYLKSSSDEDSLCIKEADCAEVLGCAAAEIYSKCGGRFCGPTCDNPLATPCPCTQGGCTCRYSYVRETSGGSCVPEAKCNATTF